MTSKPQTEIRQFLVPERERLVAEIEALQNKLAGLDMAINIVGERASRSTEEIHERRAGVTRVILDVVRESAKSGLRAEDVVSSAAGRGFLLKRGSVSSLLSQLKRDGVLVREDRRYKLAEFGRPAERSRILVTNDKSGTDEESHRHH